MSNGMGQQRSAVLRALRGDLQRFARHRYAALVVEQSLALCPPEESEPLAQELMRAAGAVTKLACHGFESRVVRALLDLPTASAQALHYVTKSQKTLRKDRFGAELLQELGMECRTALSYDGVPAWAVVCGA